jgi:hypothetical protein
VSDTSTLGTRWRAIQDGSSLGAMLTHVAKIGTMDDLNSVIASLDRSQLEAACFAMVLVHAEGAPLSDE